MPVVYRVVGDWLPRRLFPGKTLGVECPPLRNIHALKPLVLSGVRRHLGTLVHKQGPFPLISGGPRIQFLGNVILGGVVAL